MEVKIQKQANLNIIIISSNILEALNLKTNDRLQLFQEDDKIIISKPKISLKERIDNYKGDNLCKDFEWDNKKGKEKM